MLTAITLEKRKRKNLNPKTQTSIPENQKSLLSFKLEVNHLQTQKKFKSFKICHFVRISFRISSSLKKVKSKKQEKKGGWVDAMQEKAIH